MLATAVLGIVSHPTVLWGLRLPNAGFLAWIYLVPILVYLKRSDGKGTFLTGFAASLVATAVNLYWFIPAMVEFGGMGKIEAAGVLLLVVLILSFFVATALSLSAFVARRMPILPLFLLQALFLTAFDLVRTYVPVNGFPWGMIAYTQAPYLSTFQWVDTLGVFGLDFMVYLVNALIAEILFALPKGDPLGVRKPVVKDLLVSRSILVGLVVLLSVVGSILRQGNRLESSVPREAVSIGLIQGNISQLHKWNPTLARHHFGKYLRLTQKAKMGGAGLAVWPESAYPYTVPLTDLTDHSFREVGGSPLPVLFGAVGQGEAADGREPPIYNSAFFLSEEGKLTGFYHKRHLVPFGEYVPMKRWLTFARKLTIMVGDFVLGVDAAPVPYGDLKMGILICYEDIFPDLSRRSVREGANVLVNLTNDAWYGDTSAQYQHLAMSQFRALETRRFLLRATNTGMTAVIDPSGKILDALPPFTEGVLIRDIWLEAAKSPYVRLGDVVGWGAAFFSLLFFVVALLRRSSCPKN